MSAGTFAAAFLIVFREALEAGILLGAVLSLLSTLGERQLLRYVNAGLAAAALASVLIGSVLVFFPFGAGEGSVSKFFESVILFAAAAVLAHRVFWTAGRGGGFVLECERNLEDALSRGRYSIVIMFPFLAIVQRSAEAGLVLKAVSTQNNSPAVIWIWGAIFGFLAAAQACRLVRMRKIDRGARSFFKYAGIFILLVSAGFVSRGVRALEELGWIPIPVYPAWNMNHILNEAKGAGAFLKAFFGYDGNPSLAQGILYFAFLALLPFYLKLESKSAAIRSSVKRTEERSRRREPGDPFAGISFLEEEGPAAGRRRKDARTV